MRILLLVIACLMPLVVRAAEQKPDRNGVGDVASQIRLQGYDIDPKNPARITVSVGVSGGRTWFVEVGEMIRGTNLRFQNFVPKRAPGPDGVEVDTSVMTLVDVQTNKVSVVTIAEPIELLPAPAAEPKPAANGAGETLPPFQFKSYDIDPKNPKKIIFQIFNRSAGKTSFVELRERIPGTTWEVRGFERISALGPDREIKDLSEISLLDTATNKTTVLTIGKPVEVLPAPKK